MLLLAGVASSTAVAPAKPALLAPLLATALLRVRYRQPRPAKLGHEPDALVLGSAIGSRFQGMTRRLLGRYLWQSGVATLLALVVLAVFAELSTKPWG